MNCIHEFKYESVEGDTYTSKWATCLKCGLKQTIYKEVVKRSEDPMQKMYDRMFRCYEAVCKQYPDMSEENARHMAISLFIQTGRG